MGLCTPVQNKHYSLNDVNQIIINGRVKDVTKDSFSYFYLDNTFIVFTSFQNIFTLIYSTKEKSIVSFDLINFL